MKKCELQNCNFLNVIFLIFSVKNYKKESLREKKALQSTTSQHELIPIQEAQQNVYVLDSDHPQPQRHESPMVGVQEYQNSQTPVD